MVLVLGEIAVLGVAIWQLVEGNWLAAVGIVLVGGPVAYIVLDVLTGLVLLPILGIAAITNRRGTKARESVGAEVRIAGQPIDWLAEAGRTAVLERARRDTDKLQPVAKEIELAARRYSANFAEDSQLIISTCVVCGFLWRAAEHALIPDKVAFREIERAVMDDAHKGIEMAEATIRDGQADPGRYWSLYWAAMFRSKSAAPASHGSIGGLTSGEETLRWAFDQMTDYLPRSGRTPIAQKREAFDFGVNLADVEHVLSTGRTHTHEEVGQDDQLFDGPRIAFRQASPPSTDDMSELSDTPPRFTEFANRPITPDQLSELEELEDSLETLDHHALGLNQYERDLEQLREVFGKDAEMIMRGMSVASSELNSADALELVLETMERRRRGDEPADELEARVARAMWPAPVDEEIDDLDEVKEVSLARLGRDIHTSLGRFPAGTQVRVLDRMDNGQVLVGVLDLNQTVFPVDESALLPGDETR